MKLRNAVPVQSGTILIKTVKPGIVGEGPIAGCEGGKDGYILDWEVTKIHTVSLDKKEEV